MTVAIVVFAVANFGSGLGSGTGAPVGLDAGLDTFSTLGGTSSGDTFIDLAVAVVIFAIADFFARLGSAAVDPLASFAFFGSLTTSVGAVAAEAIVDLAVAVVVFVVTDFRGGLALGAALAPFAGFANPGSLSTLTLALFGEVIDLTIAVVVFVVTDLFGSPFGDLVECLLERGEIVGLVVLAGTTGFCHGLELGCIDAGTKSDHEGLYIVVFATNGDAAQGRDSRDHITAALIRHTVSNKNDETTTIFNRVARNDIRLEMFVGILEGTLHRGTPSRAEATEGASDGGCGISSH